MEQKITFRDVFPRGFITLVAILLLFILMLVIVWLWYDLQLTSLKTPPPATDSLNIISINQTDNL